MLEAYHAEGRAVKKRGQTGRNGASHEGTWRYRVWFVLVVVISCGHWFRIGFGINNSIKVPQFGSRKNQVVRREVELPCLFLFGRSWHLS